MPDPTDLDEAQRLADTYTNITENAWLTKHDEPLVYRMAALVPQLIAELRAARVSLTQAQADASKTATMKISLTDLPAVIERVRQVGSDALEAFAAELDEIAMTEQHDDHCSLTEAAQLARLRAASLLAQPEESTDGTD